MKVLVIGATGEYAGLVVPEMKKRGVEVYALIHSREKEGLARRNGADHVVLGDLKDAKSLVNATRDMEGVFHINPAFARDEVQMGIAMVSAARASGVRKFVFSGVYHPSLSMVNHSSKGPVEEALYNSGMDFTILQPAAFMQNFVPLWKDIISRKRIVQPFSNLSKIAYVDYRDVAEAAALAMTAQELSYGTFELSATGMYNRFQLAEIISEIIGEHVEAVETEPEQWVRQIQMPDRYAREGMLRMFRHYNWYGFTGGNSLVLRSILGREPRSIYRFFDELAAHTEELARK